MKRQRDNDQQESKQGMEALLPSPYNQIYIGRNTEEDRLLTKLMLAGEALSSETRPVATDAPEVAHARAEGYEAEEVEADIESLLELSHLIQAWVDRSPRNRDLLRQMPSAFSDGESSRVLFRSLFPEQQSQQTPDASGKPVLSTRELDVLHEACGDRSYEEIAIRLNISKRTVNRHFDNIYRKLGVKRSTQAVARAVSMGYMDLDVMDLIHDASQCPVRNFRAFHTFSTGKHPIASLAKSLAETGLLLLALTQASGHSVSSQHWSYQRPAAICEVDRYGRVIGTFGTEILSDVRDICVVPAHAARKGFVPGNLLVIGYNRSNPGFNRYAVYEFTPGKAFVRAFCGEREISTRISGGDSLAFSADGRLLVTSSGLTDALLAFSQEGRRVTKLADGAFLQVCSTPFDTLFAVQHSGIGCIVKELDTSGDLQGYFGETLPPNSLLGVALRSPASVFLCRSKDEDFWIDIYDLHNKETVNTFQVAGFDGGILTTDKDGNLYLPCKRTCDIQVLNKEGNPIRRIDLLGKLIPRSVALAEDGRMWVCGHLP